MQMDEILQAYANRRLIRRYTLIGFVAAELLWLAAGRGSAMSDWLFIGGLVLMGVLCVLILWRFWRCPACERALGREQYAHCPHCGTRLVA